MSLFKVFFILLSIFSQETNLCSSACTLGGNLLISTLNQYALDYKNLEPEVLPDVLKEIRFSNVDFSNQFYGNNGKREVSQSEKYANFMYLSNQLAHAFCANVEGMQNWQTNHLVQELF